jgi:hypothetical protein
MADDKELSKAEVLEKLHSAQNRLRSMRSRADDTSEELMDAAVSAGAAFAVGMYKADALRTNRDVRIAGMDPALIGGALATIVGRNVAGSSGKLVKGIGRGLLCTVAYEAGVQRGRTA